MKFITTTIAIILTTFCFAQNSIPKALEKFNKKTVPYITVNQLQSKNNFILLDSREPKEFNVSHIDKAINVGYNEFDSKKVLETVKDKSDTIVVYCSIGVRSEKIGEKLQKLGYKNVFNLYGGIFEWKNKGGSVVNNKGFKTDNIHTFDKEWSVYLQNGTKVYEN